MPIANETSIFLSAFPQRLFKHSISVMQEICSSFAAFALSTGLLRFNYSVGWICQRPSSVLALFVVSLPVNDKQVTRLEMEPVMRAWVRIVLVAMFTRNYPFLLHYTIHIWSLRYKEFSYTIGLVNMAMLTHFSFDRNVWKHDIDSSPAPFPFTLLLSILLPCLFHRPDMTILPFPTGPVDAPMTRPLCASHGTCEYPTTKLTIPQESSSNGPEDISSALDPTHTQPSIPPSETRLSIISKISRRSSITAQSLVQVPNAAQRRMSFPLTLTIWADETEEMWMHESQLERWIKLLLA